MRRPLPSTQEGVLKARKRLGCYSAIIRYYGLGVSKGTLSRIARGTESVSVRAELEVCEALKLPLPQYEALPCPSCLRHGKTEVHAVADCGGKAGQPVILAPGERVVQARPPEHRRLRKSIHVEPDLHRRLNARRLRLGLTWDHFAAGLLEENTNEPCTSQAPRYPGAARFAGNRGLPDQRHETHLVGRYRW